MGFTNSPLISYTKISPNKTVNRNHTIDTITIHCVVGQCSVETLGNVFSSASRQASSNYGIGFDGRVGMYVEEKDRSWCSSNASNDHRAITIECASDATAPYAINSKVYSSLVNLCTDICRRNGIKELKWKADKSLIGHVDKQNMTVHRWFANKSCPGDYIYNRLGQIASEVNAKLGNVSSNVVNKPATGNSTSNAKINVGDKVKIATGATYYNGKAVPDWVSNKEWIVSSVSGNRVIIDKSSDGKNSINSPLDAKYLTVTEPSFSNYLVKITANVLNVRKGPGTDYGISMSVTKGGVYTIVEESFGVGATKWGKLKSGAGWISLDYATKV